jgi:hypothetical protein
MARILATVNVNGNHVGADAAPLGETIVLTQLAPFLCPSTTCADDVKFHHHEITGSDFRMGQVVNYEFLDLRRQNRNNTFLRPVNTVSEVTMNENAGLMEVFYPIS